MPAVRGCQIGTASTPRRCSPPAAKSPLHSRISLQIHGPAHHPGSWNVIGSAHCHMAAGLDQRRAWISPQGKTSSSLLSSLGARIGVLNLKGRAGSALPDLPDSGHARRDHSRLQTPVPAAPAPSGCHTRSSTGASRTSASTCEGTDTFRVGSEPLRIQENDSEEL